MPVPLSEDLRWPAVPASLEGSETQRQIAKRLEVGEAFVTWCLRLHRETGGVALRPIPGNPAKVDAACFDVFKQVFGQMPDATRAARADEPDRRIGVRGSVATIGRMVYRAGRRRKKSRS